MNIEELEVGADACVRGNMRVEGWLDAPNVRGFLRGLYPDFAALCRSCPHPAEGWAALVGDSLPAPVYVAHHGVWQKSGGMGGSPVLVESATTGAALAQESALRRMGDARLTQALGHICGYRQLEPEWTLRSYVSLDNRMVEETGYRLSEPITLQAGESIMAELDSGGKAFPVAVIAPDQPEGWFDFPPLAAEITAGRRAYVYHAENGATVRLSCLGNPGDIAVWQPQQSLLLTALYASNGKATSATRRQQGGRLLADGSIDGKSGYGVTRREKAGHLRQVRYEGHMAAAEGECRPIAIFYDSDGAIAAMHYCGDAPVTTAGEKVRHDAGRIDVIMKVPATAQTMIFCHHLAGGPFRVTAK